MRSEDGPALRAEVNCGESREFGCDRHVAWEHMLIFRLADSQSLSSPLSLCLIVVRLSVWSDWSSSRAKVVPLLCDTVDAALLDAEIRAEKCWSQWSVLGASLC